MHCLEMHRAVTVNVFAFMVLPALPQQYSDSSECFKYTVPPTATPECIFQAGCTKQAMHVQTATCLAPNLACCSPLNCPMHASEATKQNNILGGALTSQGMEQMKPANSVKWCRHQQVAGAASRA